MYICSRYTHKQYMWKESAVSLSSCVQRRRVLQPIGLISEVEKKTPKHPFILCFFFLLPATQPISRFHHFHMSHTGPQRGTNKLTDPQLIPHCLCLCVRDYVHKCVFCFCCMCLYVSMCACFLPFQAVAVVAV